MVFDKLPRPTPLTEGTVCRTLFGFGRHIQ